MIKNPPVFGYKKTSSADEVHKIDGATLIFQLSLPELAPYLLFTNRLPGFTGPVPLPLLIRRYSVFCSVLILARVFGRVN
jgi:hypothetical protein